MIPAELLIVGRGPSARSAARWIGHRMAVSSGVFVFRGSDPPEHFVTLDCPKFFQAGLWPGEPNNAWQHDGKTRHWPFWSDMRIAKHVPQTKVKPGRYREIQPEVWNVLPEKHQIAFAREATRASHIFGFQPGWGDYSNVSGHSVERDLPLNFTDANISLGLGGVMNSICFAVQIAYWLGYRDLYFAGCDMREDFYKETIAALRDAYPAAQDRGMKWLSISDGPISEFMEPASECREAV